MAKTLTSLNAFISGDPESASPSEALVTYDVVDGEARASGKHHKVDSPDFTKTANQFWTDAITAIKTIEGIS